MSSSNMINVVIESKDGKEQMDYKYFAFRMFPYDFCSCSFCPFNDGMDWFKDQLKKRGPFNMNILLSAEPEHRINQTANLILRILLQAYDYIDEFKLDEILNIDNVNSVRVIRCDVPWTNCRKKMQERCFSPMLNDSVKNLESITGMQITQDHPETRVVADDELF